MKTDWVQVNVAFAWLWILLGFASGLVLGLLFRSENWLGGYASFKRRMYRLAHISFFGLGAVNLLFALTLKNFAGDGSFAGPASVAFVLGGLAMPVCCVVLAHVPKAHLIFAVPVVSLLLGGVLTLALIVHEPQVPGTADTVSISLNSQPSSPLHP